MTRGRLIVGACVVVGVLVLAVLCGGCASLQHPDGSVNVPAILNDARWGIMQACDEQWLSPPDCTLALDTLTFADGLAAPPHANVGPAVRTLLVDADARLPVDSRLRPYLDAAIVLLVP